MQSHNERSPCVQRSISPDGSRRVLVGDRKSGSVQGRGYGCHLGEGRADKALPGSPSYGQQRKRPHFEHEPSEYEYVVDHAVDDINSPGMKNVHGYDDRSAQVSREKDCSEGGRGIMNHQRLPVEEGEMRGSYRDMVDDINSSRMKDVHGYDVRNAQVSRQKDYTKDGHGIVNHRRMPVEEGVMKESYRLPPDMVDDINSSRMKNVHHGYDGRNAQVSREKNYSEDGRGIANHQRLNVEEGEMRGSYRLPPDMFNDINSPRMKNGHGYDDRNAQVSREKSYSEDGRGTANRRRFLVEEGEIRGSYPDMVDDINSSRMKNVHHGYDDRNSQVSREKDYSEDGRGFANHQRFPVEEGVIRRSYRLPPDMVVISQYGEHTVRLPPSSQNMDMDQVEYERRQYREPALMEPYEGEKHRYHMRDVSYSSQSAPRSMDVAGSFHNTGTSSAISSSGYLPSSDEYPRNNRRFTESTGIDVYGERPHPNIMRERHSGIGPKNIVYYQQGEYNPNKTMPGRNIACPKENADREYQPRQSNDLNRTRPVHDRLGYNHTSDRIDSRPNIVHPVIGRIDDTEISRPEQVASEYIDMRAAPYASKQRSDNLGSSAYRKRIPQDCEPLHVGESRDRQIPLSRPAYRLEGDTKFRKGRLQNHPLSMHDQEMNGGHSDNLLKRKYGMEEQIDKQNSRVSISSNRNLPPEFEDMYDEEWIDEDMNGLNFSRQGAFNHKENGKAQRTYNDGQHHGRDFASDEGLISQNSFADAPRQADRFFKNSGSRYVKHTPRPISYNSYKPHHGNTNRRNDMHKVWQRNDDYNNEYVNDDEQLEDCRNMAEHELSENAEHELSEDTDEFKQMVHDAFLVYSKMINANPAVQRRYKSQGKSGSFFCIACGKSNSKEFLDTQRLVNHASMCRKNWLRAKHLGLLKAICVLLGWNTVVLPDTMTWCPEVLPVAEASAQKEDLILWPPLVVIHNISMSNYNNPMVQKVVPIQEIQDFLRDKGIVGGKITVCLGKPADQSVMVVKFVGTFTGLGMAEKLHNYFLENKRGRIKFEEHSSDGNWETETETEGEGEDVVERLLYGYTGIAEDFDRLDFNSKKFSTIRSKKEILEMANAPVKPDNR